MPWHFSTAPLKPGSLELGGEEAHHIGRAIRHRAGDEITLFDGRGTVAQAVITSIRKDHAALDIRTTEVHPRPGPPALTLGVGLVSADSLSDALHGAAGCGIEAFVPLITERSQWGRKVKQSGKLVERLRRVAIAACKQCCSPYLPEIGEPVHLDELLGMEKWDAAVIAALLHDARAAGSALLELREEHPASTLLLVGPEGGFTKDEYNLATGKGAVPVNIGPYELRTEFAVCILAALARNLLGDG